MPPPICVICAQPVRGDELHQHVTGDYHEACFASISLANVRVERWSGGRAMCFLCGAAISPHAVVVTPAELVVHMRCFFNPPPIGRRSVGAARTLGDLLYADNAKACVSEQDWVGLVQRMAAGDRLALHALYEWTHRIVFTLIARIVSNEETAEEVTIDVFHDMWRRAATYDLASGSVVGSIMHQARSRAIDRLRLDQREKRVDHDANAPVPAASLWEQLARRIAMEPHRGPVLQEPPRPAEARWEDVAPGILCKLLATDTEKKRVSMLVRLEPRTSYPPHEHADVEELYLLDGELWIDDQKLHSGDYHRAEAGSGDQRVRSETGCTCVLITSIEDVIL